MRIKVLFVGPGRKLTGGISSLVEVIVPVLEQRVDLSYFSTVRVRPSRESGKISLRNVFLVLSQYSRFFIALTRFQPQIIHIHTSQGIAWLKDTFFVLAGKLALCKVVLHVHAADFDELHGKWGHLIQRYSRLVMSLTDAVIAVSAEWAEYLGQIVPDGRIFTLRNCINAESVALEYSHQHHSLDGPHALFLGSVGPRKGAFDLIEALSQLKSRGIYLHVWMAGYEEREGDLNTARDLLKELQLEDVCQLLGTVIGADKAQLLGSADLFVLPSYNEGLPMAILEAMAVGLPIVATPVGGIPEVVKDGFNGFLVKPGNVPLLAEVLAQLVCDSELREVMGKRSREIAQQELDVKPYVDRLLSLYQSLASE